ncbi:MAG: ABC transporter substrate-binding protein [Coprococcus sp.]
MMETEHTLQTDLQKISSEKPCLIRIKDLRYKAPVVCGPYKLKSVDLTTETVELEINEEYLGTYDGTKPHIQTIISKPVADETIRDEFEKGTIDFYSAGTGEKIEAALTKVEEGKLDANYGLVSGNTYQRDALYV